MSNNFKWETQNIIADDVARFMYENGIELDWQSLAWVFRAKGISEDMVQYMPIIEQKLKC